VANKPPAIMVVEDRELQNGMQVGLLDPTNLPVAGAEQARQLLRLVQGQGRSGQT